MPGRSEHREGDSLSAGLRWTLVDGSAVNSGCSNSKTTLVDSGGRSTVCIAFRRSGVRIPSGPPNLRDQNRVLDAPRSPKDGRLTGKLTGN